MARYEFDFEAIKALPPGEQMKAVALVREFREQLLRNPLEGYDPLAHQARMHAARQRLRALFGGNRAGKTTGGVVDDLFEVTPRELVPDHLQKFKREEWECPRYVRCMAPSTKLLNAVMIQKFREYTPKALLKGGRFGQSFSKQEGVLYLECGCRVDFLSYEMDLDKFGGAALHRCHYDEEPPEEIRKECFARLTDFRGTELFTMTPLLGMTWMHDDIWLKAEWQREQFPDEEPKIWAEAASMLDNTTLDPLAVAEALEEWGDSEDAAARIYGHFVHFGGMVYPQFKDSIGDPPDIEWVQSCDVVVGLDPGIAGGAAVWVAFDGRNDAVVFAERYTEGMDVDAVADAIDEVNEAWGLSTRGTKRPNAPLYVIDPSARARQITTGVTIESAYNMAGIYPAWGQADREAGCLMIRGRMNRGQMSISRDLRRLPWEMHRYRVQPREDGKWDVIKQDDHACDALRYAITSRPWRTNPEGTPVKPPALTHAQGPPRKRVNVSGPLES